MQTKDVQRVQDVIERLEGVAKEKARAEGRLESAMTSLKDLGYATIVEGEAALATIEKSIERRKLKLEKDFEEFTMTYGSILDGRV